MNGYRVFRSGGKVEAWLISGPNMEFGYWTRNENEASTFPETIAQILVDFWQVKLYNEKIERVPVAIEE